MLQMIKTILCTFLIHVHAFTICIHSFDINFDYYNDTKNILPYERQALYDLYTATNDRNVNPCLEDNHWQGLNCTIEIANSRTYYILDIFLSKYNLVGSLPDSIGNFSRLQILDLSYNDLSGSTPHTISNLSSLINLDLSFNSISGTLPFNLYKLSNLQILNLDSNYNIEGTLSNELVQLSQLRYLNLRLNKFTSTIPYNIGNLSYLTYLRLSGNLFTGTIPNSISNLTSLTLLILAVNQLRGTFPEWIGNLHLLIDFSLNDNYLTGTIPSNLSNLTSLISFYISDNQFSGTIPNNLGDLLSLNTLRIGNNYLVGTMPYTLSKLIDLKIFDLHYNRFTDVFPNWIGNLTSLEYLDLSYNLLTGSIPTILSNLTNLYWISLSGNLFIGSIPNIFSKLVNLQYFKADNNQLIGIIPSSIASLPVLNTLFLQKNHFTGKLDDVFNKSYQKQISYIQLDNNHFTGNLPIQVFSKSLIVFSAVSNCFHGSIPSTVCDTDLHVLALDGLVCASSCGNKIFPGISNAYLAKNKINGGIPRCLWSMSNLQVLHLSGNKLTGTLPSDVKISSTLTDLSLSYNVLTGSIPNSFHKQKWNNLDLSHNRISGTLRSNYTFKSINASLSLKNNRLSGIIPQNLQNMKDINILEGSYYNCKYDHSDLPTHDDYKEIYKCGSNLFNILSYIWVGMVFIVTAIILGIWYFRDKLDRYIQISSFIHKLWNWVHAIELLKYSDNETVVKQIQSMKYFQQFENINKMILRFSLYCTIFIIIILLPSYLILNHYYSTHSYEYAWTVSISFMGGKTAFGVILSLMMVFIITQIYINTNIIKNSSYNLAMNLKVNIEEDNNDKVEYEKYNKCKIYCIYTAYFLISIVVGGFMNILYVYMSLYLSNVFSLLAQILLSIFKISWNNVISPKMVRWIIDNLSVLNIGNNRIIQRRLFVLQFLLSLLMNIAIPCLVVIIISPNCLYNMFHYETDETTSFSYMECDIYYNDNRCYQYSNHISSSSYKPPFTYSYQCSSDFITYYVPVFVFICLLSTFVIPVIQICLHRLSLRYNWLTDLIKYKNLLNLNISTDITVLMNIDDIYEYLVSELTLVALLLTFGAVFPPLAIALLITFCRRMLGYKAMIGKYILTAIEFKAYPCLDIIEKDCKVIPTLSTVQHCGLLIIYASCFFNTFFLFDILGDGVGFYEAYWVLITIPCIPVIIHLVYKSYRYYLEYVDNQQNLHISKNTELELPIVSIENPLVVNVDNSSKIVDYNEDGIVDIDVDDRDGKSIISI